MESAEEAVKAAPTVMDTGLTEQEEKILKAFRERLAKAHENEHIANPAAWALYWTWKGLEMWSNVIDRREADHDAD